MDIVRTLKRVDDAKDLAFTLISAKTDASLVSVAESFLDRALAWATLAAQGKGSFDKNLDADAARMRKIIDGGYRREDIDAARAHLRETSVVIQAQAERIKAAKG